MRKQLLLAATLALSSSVPSLTAFAQTAPMAEPGTPDGAKALEKDLSAYLSPKPFTDGFVTVSPDPFGYRITLDAKKALEKIEFEGFKGSATFGTVSVLVGELPDGTWSVESRDPIKFAYDVVAEGIPLSMKYDIGPGGYKGVYSPELGAFLSTTGRYEAATLTQTDPQSDVKASFGPQTYDMTATKAGEGAVDLKMTQTLSAFSEKIESAVDPATPGERVSLTLGAKTADINGSAKALKSRALLDLWAFFVAHADKEKLVAAEEELKTHLRKLLPIWDDIDGRYVFNDMDVTTPVGTFSAAKASADFSGDGIEAAGDYRYSFGFEGLSVNSPMVPAWAGPLIPADFTLATTITGVDLAGPAAIMIDDLDLSRPEPISEAAGQKVLAGFEAKPPRIVVEPSRIKAGDYEITMAGDVSFDGGASPNTRFSIEVAGLDRAIKTLQDAGATDDRALQVVGPISMAQGFGKRLPDGRTQWVIETTSDGAVSINGARIKGPDAAAPQPGDAPTDDNAMPEEDPAGAQ